ncbi:MAG: hypothetical protein KAT40_06305 [Bacteroidales bacterium]|nr:hypothetical protein [Bacteroidales bacterium]
MIKKLFNILIILFLTISVSGQKWRHTWTEGLIGGGMGKLFADIGGGYFKPVFHGGVRFKTGKYWTVKANAIYSQAAGSDFGTSRSERGYLYNTTFAGVTAQLEYYLLVWNEEQIGINSRGLVFEEPEWTVYTFFGGGALYFDPEPGGNLINEPTDYKKLSFTISGGLGGKYSIGKHLTIGIELGLHYPYSDYIDGYSPDEKGISDLYFSTIASIGYKLNLSSGTRLTK